MRRLAIILMTLCLLAGCTKQAEYGPKAEPLLPRYTAQRIKMPMGFHDLVEYRDSLTGDTWLVVTDFNEFATLLPRARGEP